MAGSHYIHITKPRLRRITLKLTEAGEVIVTSPPHTPQSIIDTFITKNTDWIIRHQAKILSRKQYHTNETIHIFGTEYIKSITTDPAAPIGVVIANNQILIKHRAGLNPATQIEDATQVALDRFLKSTATHYIVPRTQHIAHTMGTTYKKITLRDTSSRWGSCSSTGSLQFSWRLVHFAPAIIDYVIIHELAHRTHMNHSQAFWQLVARYDPEYKKHRAILKRASVRR